MRIDQDVKLDYKDVLIRPKRSTLKSRSQVRLERKFTFRHSKQEYEGVPIMASNMDGVGTFEIADALAQQNIFTCLVKTYTSNELIDFFNTDDYLRTNNVAMSIGSSDADFLKLVEVQALADSNLKFCFLSQHF